MTATASTSGLSAHHREQARTHLLRGVHQLMADPGAVHYTMGAARWDLIASLKHVGQRILPCYGDCSSTATWLLKEALQHVHPGYPDIVNGANWQAGYTGTQAGRGKRVVHDGSLKVGDLIFYGGSTSVPEHVAVYIGGGHVFSHGGEAGPFILPIDYRGDRHKGNARRFI